MTRSAGPPPLSTSTPSSGVLRGRPRDPADRGFAAGARRQGPGRPGRLHRPLELPAAAARVEARAGPRRRQRHRLQAVGADAALDPRARVAASNTCRPASSTSSPVRATSAAALVADERIECVAFTGSVGTGKRIAAVCAERVARVNLEMGGKDPFIVCPDVADKLGIAARGGVWAAFLNAGQVCTSAERFYIPSRALRRLRRRVRRAHRLARRRRPDGPGDRHRADGLGVAAPEGRRPARRGGRRGRRGRHRRRARRPRERALLLPRRRRRRRRLDRAAERGDVRARRAARPGRLARRGDRGSRTRPASASASTSTRRTWRRCCAACASSRRGRCGSTTR